MKRQRKLKLKKVMSVTLATALVTSNLSYANTISTKANINVKSIIGENRYDTSVKISQHMYSSIKANNVIIVNGSTMADGLTATPLASIIDAPILLTSKDSLPKETKDELKRLNPKNVTIIGGEGVISQKAVENIKAILPDIKIDRIGGKDRYETSLKIAQAIDTKNDVKKVYIGYGYGEPDALSIAAKAGQDKQPIILSQKESLDKDTYEWLKKEELETAYFIGGDANLKDSVINEVNFITKSDIKSNRIAGKDRHETNAKVIEKFYTNDRLNSALVTKSNEMVDALTAGPLASKLKSPIILASQSELSENQKTVLDKKSTEIVYRIGGGINNEVFKDIVLRLTPSKNTSTGGGTGSLGELEPPVINPIKDKEEPKIYFKDVELDENKTIVSENQTINISGKATDNVKVNKVYYKLNNQKNEKNEYKELNSVNNWTIENIELELGNNELTVVAVDTSGNYKQESINIFRNGFVVNENITFVEKNEAELFQDNFIEYDVIENIKKIHMKTYKDIDKFKVNGIYIFEETNELPVGFAMKLVSKYNEGDNIILEIEDPTIDEVFISQNLYINEELDTSNIVFDTLIDGVELKTENYNTLYKKGGWDFSTILNELRLNTGSNYISLNFDDAIIYDKDGNEDTKSDQFKLDGEAGLKDIKVQQAIQWNLKDGLLPDQIMNKIRGQAHLSLTPKYSGDIEIKPPSSITINNKNNIFGASIQGVNMDNSFPIGAVGIPLGGTISVIDINNSVVAKTVPTAIIMFTMDMSGNISASLELDMNANYEITKGFNLQDSKYNGNYGTVDQNLGQRNYNLPSDYKLSIYDKNKDASVGGGLNLVGSATANLSIGPQVGVMVFGIIPASVKSHVGGEISATGKAGISFEDKQITINSPTNAILERSAYIDNLATLRVKAEIPTLEDIDLKLGLGWRINLWEVEDKLVSEDENEDENEDQDEGYIKIIDSPREGDGLFTYIGGIAKGGSSIYVYNSSGEVINYRGESSSLNGHFKANIHPKYDLVEGEILKVEAVDIYGNKTSTDVVVKKDINKIKDSWRVKSFNLSKNDVWVGDKVTMSLDLYTPGIDQDDIKSVTMFYEKRTMSNFFKEPLTLKYNSNSQKYEFTFRASEYREIDENNEYIPYTYIEVDIDGEKDVELNLSEEMIYKHGLLKIEGVVDDKPINIKNINVNNGKKEVKRGEKVKISLDIDSIGLSSISIRYQGLLYGDSDEVIHGGLYELIGSDNRESEYYNLYYNKDTGMYEGIIDTSLITISNLEFIEIEVFDRFGRKKIYRVESDIYDIIIN